MSIKRLAVEARDGERPESERSQLWGNEVPGLLVPAAEHGAIGGDVAVVGSERVGEGVTAAFGADEKQVRCCRGLDGGLERLQARVGDRRRGQTGIAVGVVGR